MNYLSNYIKQYIILNESFDAASSRRLDEVILRINNLIESISNSPYAHQHAYIDNLMLDMKINEIGEGISRTAYSNLDDFYVIKVAMDTDGIKANNDEVEISNRRHGSEAQDLFLQLFAYDQVNKEPLWIISEKVTPLDKVDDINILKKIFPTFDKITNGLINDCEKYLHFVTYVLQCLDFSSDRLDKLEDIFVRVTKYFWGTIMGRDINLLEIDELELGEDINKFERGFANVYTSDLHVGNIAIRSSQNPSPEDIVILDFDIEFMFENIAREKSCRI